MTVPGTNMNAAQARVGVDLVLSSHARGYSNNQYVGGALFPTVLMPTRSAKRIEFGRDAFRLRQTRRAPGAAVARSAFGYEGLPVGLHQEALDAVTPVEHQEEALAIPGVDLQTQSVNTVLALIALSREFRQAQLARDATKYDARNKLALAGGDRFSDDASDPLEIVSDARETVRARTGRRPNTALFSAPVAAKLKKHEKIRSHFRPTGSSSVSDGMLASYFDLERVVIGDTIYDDDAGVQQDVWGNDAIVAYVPGEGERSMAVPAYGYTYQLNGHPFVEEVRWIADVRSWGNQVIDEFSPEMVGPDAGFLIQNAV